MKKLNENVFLKTCAPDTCAPGTCAPGTCAPGFSSGEADASQGQGEGFIGVA